MCRPFPMSEGRFVQTQKLRMQSLRVVLPTWERIPSVPTTYCLNIGLVLRSNTVWHHYLSFGVAPRSEIPSK